MIARWFTAASLLAAEVGATAEVEDGAQMRRLVMNAFLPTELSQALPAVKDLIRTKVADEKLHLTMIISDEWKPMEIESLKKEFRAARCGEDEACVEKYLHVASLPSALYKDELFPEWVQMLIHADWWNPKTLHSHRLWRAFHPAEEGGTHPALAEWFHSENVLPYLAKADYIVADIFSPVWKYSMDFLPHIPRSVWMGNRELLAEKFVKLEPHLVDPEYDVPHHGPTAYVATISPFYENFDVPLRPLPGGLSLGGLSSDARQQTRELLRPSRDNDESGENLSANSRIALVNPLGSESIVARSAGSSPVSPASPMGGGIMGELERRVALDPKLQIVYFSFGSFDVRLSEAGLVHLLDKYLVQLWEDKVGDNFLVLLRLNVVQADDSSVPDERIREILKSRNGLLWDGEEKVEDNNIAAEAKVIVARDYLPQKDMMQRFADRMVMVAHGGVGGVSDAIALTVPVIVLPGTPEQMDNGIAVDEIALGCTLPAVAWEMKRNNWMKVNGTGYTSATAVSVTRASAFYKHYMTMLDGVDERRMAAKNQGFVSRLWASVFGGDHGSLPTLVDAVRFWVEQRRSGALATARDVVKTRMERTALGAAETASVFWDLLEVGFNARRSEGSNAVSGGAVTYETRRVYKRRTLMDDSWFLCSCSIFFLASVLMAFVLMALPGRRIRKRDDNMHDTRAAAPLLPA